MDDSDMCIRCNEAPAFDERGCCPPCHWAVVAEAEEDRKKLAAYLTNWAEFSNWCEARGHAAV